MPKKARTDEPHQSSRDRKEVSRDDLSERQLEAMQAIAGAVAIPVDQLARFLDTRCADASKTVARLEAVGCLHSRQYLSGESRWVWLSWRGANICGGKTRERQRPPALSSLEHRRAVHEVRLHLEASFPSGRWIPEAYFYKTQRGSGLQIPDGVFEVDGERQAVEVELWTKPLGNLRKVVSEHSSRYDAVLYFCGLRTRKRLAAIEADGRWSKLVVQDLPGLPTPTKRRGHYPAREPLPREEKILRLISEQGAIPMDQLCRFMKAGAEEALEIVEEFERQSYAKRASFLAGEPEWVWLKKAGNRFSGTTLECARPRIGALGQLRAFNELRLRFGETGSGDRWLSKRQLRRAFGRYAMVPDAAIESGSSRKALMLRTHNRNFASVEERIEALDKAFDSVLFLCGSQLVLRRMEAFLAEHPSYALELASFPQRCS